MKSTTTFVTISLVLVLAVLFSTTGAYLDDGYGSEWEDDDLLQMELRPPMERRGGKINLNDFIMNRINKQRVEEKCAGWNGYCRKHDDCCSKYRCKCNIFIKNCRCH